MSFVTQKNRKSGSWCRRVGVLLLVVLVVCVPAWGHDGLHERIRQLDRKIKTSPRDGSLYLQRGELHRLHRDWDQATSDYDRAGKFLVRPALVDFCRSRMFLDSGRWEEGLKAIESHLVLDPRSALGLFHKARLLEKLGRREECVRIYAQAFPLLSRPRPDHYFARARVLLSLGRTAEAVRGLEQGLVCLNHPAALVLEVIRIEVESGRHDSALGRLDRILEDSPRKDIWLIRKAEILSGAGRPQEAIVACRRALYAMDHLPGRAGRLPRLRSQRKRLEAMIDYLQVKLAAARRR